MGLLHPELLLLALPVALLWWHTRSQGRVTLVLRAAVGALLVLALAGPYLSTRDSGRDLVVVVDRSRSMPPGALDSALEIIGLAEDERGPGDQVYVVGFGAQAAIEHATLGKERFQGFSREVDRDGSDLGGALETALELIRPARRGSVLLISDGEGNGQEPLPAARRAFARGVRIDVRADARPGTADLLVERVDLPGEVAVGEPFQFNVWVRSDRRIESEFRLVRGARVLSSGVRTFEAGINRLVFRDVLERPGVAEYEVRLAADDDRVPENNRGLGAVRATGSPAILVLNDDGAEDSLTRALRRARIPVAVATPEGARLDPVGLSAFRGVILENVAASRLGRGIDALRDWVLDRGGGLLVTGGRASFGVGGYYLSAIEELLPVTMELRQEHRKMSVALAVALDRSGSMAAAVTSNLTKMDLANLGTVAAIELLSPMDEVAVIAIDSSPHVIQPLTPVRDIAELTRRVRRIESMGGGIFVDVALRAAGLELNKSDKLNRHVILFSDAADSERPAESMPIVRRLAEAQVSVSVIALGSESDVDAAFLKDLARIGGGEAYFTNRPEELPRLFAMDTMTISRSTFVDEPTGVEGLPDLFGLGSVSLAGFPVIGGYNLTYLRAEAQAGAVTTDEYRAPIVAFMQRGLGRSAAYTGQIGGSHGAALVAWEGFGELFVTVARWLLGQEEPREFFTSVRREGKQAVISVEVDPDAPLPPDTSELRAVLAGPGGERTELVLERAGEHLFEARTLLRQTGVSVGAVHLGGDRFVSLPPVVLPYSPEFERSPDPERGQRLLRRIARESGGRLGVTAGSLFRGERGGRLWRVVTRELTLLALILMLVEIAGRRLSLWGALRVPAAVTSVGRILTAGVTRRRRARSRRREVEVPARAAARGPGEAPTPSESQGGERRSPTGVGPALSRARRAADRKLGR